MRREVALAGLGFWLLVSALVALWGGRARADVKVATITPAAQGAPVTTGGAAAQGASVPTGAPGTRVTRGQFHGQVLFSDIMIASPAQFPSDAAMSEALRRLKRTTVEGTDGFWRLHMVAFLEPAPQGTSFRLRATDVTDPKDRRQVKMFEIDGQPGQTELEINDLVVTNVMGFERGHRYEIAVMPRGDDLPAGKGDVYAKGVITLM
jgi:hypothetical protein